MLQDDTEPIAAEIWKYGTFSFFNVRKFLAVKKEKTTKQPKTT